MIEQAPKPAPHVQEMSSVVLVSERRGLSEMVERIDPALPLFFDTETTGYAGSDMRTDRVVSLQFHQGDTTWISDVRKTNKSGRLQIGKTLAHALDGVMLVGHNLKFDLSILLLHFGFLHTKVWDTMLAEQVIYGLGLSDGRKKGVGFGLKDVAERRGIHVEKETRESFKNMHQTPAWNQSFTPEQLEYMAQDVLVLPAIYESQKDRFDEDIEEIPYPRQTLTKLWGCFKLEMEVLPALVHIETSGVPVAWEPWMEIINQKAVEADALKEEVTLVLGEAILEARRAKFEAEWIGYEAWERQRDGYLTSIRDEYDQNAEFWKGQSGDNVEKWGEHKNRKMKAWREEHPNPGKPKTDTPLPNIGSTAQLMAAFAELGIPAKDTTEQTLSDLAEEFEVVRKLMEYRKAVKFVQSFGESLQVYVSSADGRLHPDYMQIGASTNRMSCTRPNFQQIPSRGKTGQALRKCVQASPGFKILTADFGSQELCIIADLSGDETMLRLFEDGADLHSATARMMFGLAENVDPKTYEIAHGVSARTAAKTINYGLAYGQTEYGLAMGLGIQVDQAKRLIEAWYTPYAQVKRYFDARKAQIFRGELYSETLHGWKRHYEPLPAEPGRPQSYSRVQDYTKQIEYQEKVLSSLDKRLQLDTLEAAEGRKELRDQQRMAQERLEKLRESYRAWGQEKKLLWSEYSKALREWEKAKRRLENKLMNTPIQGTGAGITKKALADFFRVVCSYNAINVQVRIIAVVHDELVVEVPAEYAQEVAAKLAECMDNAMSHFLRRVRFPKSDVHISDCWSK